MHTRRGFSTSSLLIKLVLVLLVMGAILFAGHAYVTQKPADTFVAASESDTGTVEAVGTITTPPTPIISPSVQNAPTAKESAAKPAASASTPKTQGTVAMKDTHTGDIVIEYKNVPLESQVQLYNLKTDERSDRGDYAGSLIQNTTSGLHTIAVQECVPSGQYYVRIMKQGVVMAQSAPFQFGGTEKSDPRCSGQTFNSLEEYGKAMPPQVSCELKTGKEIYTRGEPVVLSWTTIGAAYVAFDVSGSEPINLPAEKLAASGSVTIQPPQNYAGPTYALLRAYGDASQGYCRKNFEIKFVP